MNDARNANYAALLLRVSLGRHVRGARPAQVLRVHAAGHRAVLPIHRPARVLGYVTFGAELVGGILLIAGVRTRLVSLALVPVLLGATWAHAGNGWLFTSPNGGWEYPRVLDGRADRAGVPRRRRLRCQRRFQLDILATRLDPEPTKGNT
jgi:putative oxidoreductase